MALPPKPRREEITDLPEAGGPVYLQTLKISERRKVSELESTDQGLKTLAMCVVDGEGKPIWTEDEWDVFAGNDTKRFFAYVNKSFEQSGLLDTLEKKDETPS